MSQARALMLVVAAAACGSSEAPKPDPVPAAPVAADAGAADAVALQPGEGTPRAATKRPSRPIEIVLRSSPVPANVSVDGAPLGTTPQVWLGDSGAEHEFAFQAPGYAMARFRFTPITSGLIHPRLEPVTEDIDAGVAPPPEVMAPRPPAPVSVDVDAQPAPIAPSDVPAPVAPSDAATSPIGPQP